MYVRLRTVPYVLVIVLLGASSASAQETVLPPSQEPILRIEPGMHTAVIRSISVDAGCTLMATGSQDKTVRLWSLLDTASGTPGLLRTLRPPIGPDTEGV